MMTFATELYKDAKDRSSAMNSFKDIVAAGLHFSTMLSTCNPNTSTSGDGTSNNRPLNPTSADNIEANVAMIFSDLEKNFAGDIGEFWQKFVDEYRQMNTYYGLFSQQKLQDLLILLNRDAELFYLNVFNSYTDSLHQALYLVASEYNSHFRQSKVNNYLRTFPMSSFMNNGM